MKLHFTNPVLYVGSQKKQLPLVFDRIQRRGAAIRTGIAGRISAN